ncbi:hypothetical protein BJ165DRAFT_1615461 [Panaeolus papilionaceus]|nr:hypothetical protein BJ165DRAFT_1615461 [Panaeolus papilionaceus]
MNATFPYFTIEARDAGDSSCNRTVWSIAWSCFITVFTCTWVAIHPNAASEREESKVVAIRRIGLMITMFLVPEMVICWALRQSLLAGYYAKIYEKNPSKIKWKKGHGFFLMMGGFTYYNERDELEILTAKKMEALYNEGKIEWPRVTAKQIRDRSKADPLAKFIVIGQTIWFCLQVIVRLATHLVVTELEISTFAFAVLNLIVYVLWWDKPFDVRSHIIVPSRNSPAAKFRRIPETTQNAEQPNPDIQQQAPDAQQSTTERPDDSDAFDESTTELPSILGFWPYVCHIISDAAKWLGSSLCDIIMGVFNRLRPRHDKTPTLPVAVSDTPGPSPPTSDRVLSPPKIRWRPYLRGKFQKIWTALCDADLDGVLACLALYLALLHGLFGAPFVNHYVEKGHQTTSGDRYNTEDAKKRHPLCGWLFNFSTQLIVVGLIGSIFGGVHLIAWGFHFPTEAEMWLWRSCSLALILPPFLFQIGSIIKKIFNSKFEVKKGWQETVVMWLGTLFMVICAASYMTARGIISILPIVALRDAPPGAFVNIQWTSLIPHI